MKTSQELLFGRPAQSSSNRNILARQSRTGTSSVQDSHARRLELVRAEVADSLIRQRLLSLLKSESSVIRGQSKSKVEAKEEPSEESLKVKKREQYPAFPTDDEGVDFSWIYHSGSQEGIGNYDGSIGDDRPGIELVLKPFGFTKVEAAAPALENISKDAEIIETTTLPKAMFPVSVDVKLRRIDVSPESGNISDDQSIIYGTESESDMEFFDEDDF